ncbi:MAG: hypothetical protein KAI93_15910 [Desulfobacterales bacterium]|nr:hypothetical protein [Desulfobacterales bacterium]
MSLFSTHPPLEERIARLRGYPSRKGRVQNPVRITDWRKVRHSGIDFQGIRYWVLGIGD